VSTYIRLLKLAISVEGEEREEKEKHTGNLVSTLNPSRTYESLMRIMYVSQSTSCMISIRRLDKMLGPSSVNLERNWSHC
jgi:hypothetical protein